MRNNNATNFKYLMFIGFEEAKRHKTKGCIIKYGIMTLKLGHNGIMAFKLWLAKNPNITHLKYLMFIEFEEVKKH